MNAATLTVNDTAGGDVMLLERIRRGDQAAFADLYGRHKQVVYLYCVRFLGRQATADDVFQDTFMRCFERIRDGEDITNVRAYLLTTARNRCLNMLRDRKFPDDVDELPDQPAATGLDAGELLDLERALAIVPDDLRESLLLCEYQGYSYQEIADLIHVPVSTVRKRIFRARQKLRGILCAPTRGRRSHD